MKEDPIKEGRISENSHPVGTVTKAMVLARAREIAIIDGRSPHEVKPSDWAQAHSELTGESEESPNEIAIESLPESERWDPVPGSPGHRAYTSPDPYDESDNERLVREGLEDAEHDQRVQGGKDAIRRDSES